MCVVDGGVVEKTVHCQQLEAEMPLSLAMEVLEKHPEDCDGCTNCHFLEHETIVV